MLAENKIDGRRMKRCKLIRKVKLVIFIIMEWNVPEMA